MQLELQLCWEHWKEVSRRVSPSSFMAPSRLASTIQWHKHLSSAVFPAKRRIRVVAVLLDPLLKLAAWAISYLQKRAEITTKFIFKTSENLDVIQMYKSDTLILTLWFDVPPISSFTAACSNCKNDILVSKRISDIVKSFF